MYTNLTVPAVLYTVYIGDQQTGETPGRNNPIELQMKAFGNVFKKLVCGATLHRALDPMKSTLC